MSSSRTAFVTTCKGRLDHLKQTITHLVALEPAEIIVGDFDCPDGTADWVRRNHPAVKVIKVVDAPNFNLSHARNSGAAACESDWIFFCDADIIFDKSIVDWFHKTNLNNTTFYRQEQLPNKPYYDTFGTCLVNRHAFNAAGGYDDVISGWGGEDLDLYFRLQNMKNN